MLDAHCAFVVARGLAVTSELYSALPWHGREFWRPIRHSTLTLSATSPSAVHLRFLSFATRSQCTEKALSCSPWYCAAHRPGVAQNAAMIRAASKSQQNESGPRHA